MAAHTDATVGNVHVIYNWTYANSTAREAATGMTATDVGKFCRQLDDDTLWMLTDDDPVTWKLVTAEGDMLKSVYDTDDDGKVDAAEVADSATTAGTADEVDGVDVAGNSKYYGTDEEGAPGFHNLPSGSGADIKSICNGRLTLESGVPLSTTDQTAKTTLYFTPFKGNQICLYDGSNAWEIKTFTELSLDISGYTADKNYDIWVYSDSGTVTLDSTIWTDDITRATTLTLQDGIYVKNGATTRRYVGTIRITTTAGQCEDSMTKRFIWNYYNREIRLLEKSETTLYWDYGIATWRSMNNSNANRVEIVVGIACPVDLTAAVSVRGGSSIYGHIGIGEDKTNNNDGKAGRFGGGVIYMNIWSFLEKICAEGYHYYQAVEYGEGSTPRFYGYDASMRMWGGIFGKLIG